jgi:hypothetical protein
MYTILKYRRSHKKLTLFLNIFKKYTTWKINLDTQMQISQLLGTMIMGIHNMHTLSAPLTNYVYM